MKILHLNIVDNLGAGTAAYRLHKALRNAGEDSYMLVRKKMHLEDEIINTDRNWFHKIISKIYEQLNYLEIRQYKRSTKSLFTNSSYSKEIVQKTIQKINPDIIHLHWFTKGFLKVNILPELKKPTVISLHDMWAFTGGCHFDYYCGKYITGCGKCPMINSEKENDISTYYQKRKKKAFGRIDKMVVVGLSRWIADCAKQSEVFRDKTVVNLPNCIDIDYFKPYGKIKARKELNLPVSKKLILFGAHGATSDIRKGFKELCEAIKTIKNEDFELVVFGNDEKIINPGMKVHQLGQVHDEDSLIKIYSSADVTVVPSLQENLSNVIMESNSCGTPVVAFDIGGNKDQVIHKVNGYLAVENNSSDLANGINWCLENEEKISKLSGEARNWTVNNFHPEIISKKYIQLYKALITQEQK